MNPEKTDLLEALATNHWRLDLQREQPLWRVMWWCADCRIWRCVEESGIWHATPKAAIEAAIAAKNP